MIKTRGLQITLKLAQTFNEFFVNSVENFAITVNVSSNLNPININDILFPYEIHASVIAIKPNMLVSNPVFTFKNANKIGAILKNLVTYKAPKSNDIPIRL